MTKLLPPQCYTPTPSVAAALQCQTLQPSVTAALQCQTPQPSVAAALQCQTPQPSVAAALQCQTPQPPPNNPRDPLHLHLQQPESVVQYNTYMGGVDRGDQLRGYYSCRTKSRKFYKYIFYFLFDVAVTNSYILYKNYSPDHTIKRIKDFRLKLATHLIGDYCSRRRPGRNSSAIVLLPLQHFSIKLSNESHPTKKQRGRCAHCSKSHQRTDTSWFCRECDVWLCHSGDPSSDCFLLWHKHRVGAEQ